MLRGFAVGLGVVTMLGGPALAATFTVDSTGDGSDTSAGDGMCIATSGGCTLRAAIEEANAHPDADTIAFDIPGSGVHTIHVVGGSEGGSDIPFLVAPVTIDGFTQAGSQPNTNVTGALNATPTIELDGSGSFHCFFALDGGTTTIRGLVINGCHSEVIGLGSGTTLIEGNFIGTDVTGTVAKTFGGAPGITMFVQSGGLTFTAGGTTPAARNLISGNGGSGIEVRANLDSSINATIQGNLIGTDKTGTAPVPNFNGITSFGAGNDHLVLTIGGSAPGAGNVVSGNTVDGIQLGHFSANSVVQGNLVGTEVDGTSALGNGQSGIVADFCPLTIGGTMPGEGNVVAHNGSAGILVSSDRPGCLISGNSIFANGGPGIDLSSTAPAPVLAAGVFPGGTSVQGTLDAAPSTTFRVEVFSSDACDPSGNGVGQRFVGANDEVTSDASGHASFTVTLAPPVAFGTILTATAIGADHSTSEFGPCTGAPTFTAEWDVSSSMLPDQVCPAWTIFDTAAADPVLASGVLSLASGANEILGFSQTAPLLSVPDPLVIRARLRLAPGGTAGGIRGPAGIGFFHQDLGNDLFIAPDEIFLLADASTKGPSVAVDTDAFHTYQIEVGGTGEVQVFYDSVLALTGTTFAVPGAGSEITWGDLTGQAGVAGTSEWQFVRHDAAVCAPPPTSTTTTTSTISSTSTSSTIRPPAPTTTTTLPGCAAVPDGPTFASVRCRLETLRASTAAATLLGDLRPKLDQALGKALDRTQAADGFCAGAKKHAKSRLKPVIRQLMQYSHRLRGLTARKKAPPDVREPLAAEADAIKADTADLRRTLSCPGGA